LKQQESDMFTREGGTICHSHEITARANHIDPMINQFPMDKNKFRPTFFFFMFFLVSLEYTSQ